MAIDFGIIGDYIGDAFDTDKIDIGRSQLIMLPDGSTSVTDPKVPIYTNVSCHISSNQTPNPDSVTAGTVPIIVSITINCAVDIDLQNMDFIKARKLDASGNVLMEYEGSIGVPIVNQSRQEAIMVARQAT